jgi:hypothetical protein
MTLDGFKVVQARNGKVISGFGFYAWGDGPTVRVVVLAHVSPDNSENKFFPLPRPVDVATMNFQQFASCALAPGIPRTVSELKALGIQPMTLRAETQALKDEPAELRSWTNKSDLLCG